MKFPKHVDVNELEAMGQSSLACSVTDVERLLRQLSTDYDNLHLSQSRRVDGFPPGWHAGLSKLLARAEGDASELLGLAMPPEGAVVLPSGLRRGLVFGLLSLGACDHQDVPGILSELAEVCVREAEFMGDSDRVRPGFRFTFEAITDHWPEATWGSALAQAAATLTDHQIDVWTAVAEMIPFADPGQLVGIACAHTAIEAHGRDIFDIEHAIALLGKQPLGAMPELLSRLGQLEGSSYHNDAHVRIASLGLAEVCHNLGQVYPPGRTIAFRSLARSAHPMKGRVRKVLDVLSEDDRASVSKAFGLDDDEGEPWADLITLAAGPPSAEAWASLCEWIVTVPLPEQPALFKRLNTLLDDWPIEGRRVPHAWAKDMQPGLPVPWLAICRTLVVRHDLEATYDRFVVGETAARALLACETLPWLERLIAVGQGWSRQTTPNAPPQTDFSDSPLAVALTTSEVDSELPSAGTQAGRFGLVSWRVVKETKVECEVAADHVVSKTNLDDPTVLAYCQTHEREWTTEGSPTLIQRVGSTLYTWSAGFDGPFDCGELLSCSTVRGTLTTPFEGWEFVVQDPLSTTLERYDNGQAYVFDRVRQQNDTLEREVWVIVDSLYVTRSRWVCERAAEPI